MKMMRLSARMLLLFGLLALIPPPILNAGGWAIVTLDMLPDSVIANQPITLGFTVRQHGQTLVALGKPGPTIEARNQFTDETLTITAHQSGFIGHYQANVSFPQPGLWEWQITPNPFGNPAKMPPLLVLPNETEHATRLDRTVEWFTWWRATMLQRAPIMNDRTSGLPDPTVSARGKALFLAKSCAACHRHESVHSEWSVQIGPDLTHYDKSEAFLTLWLADPSAVKPTTTMPNLGLDSAEIEALSAFLTNKSSNK